MVHVRKYKRSDGTNVTEHNRSKAEGSKKISYDAPSESSVKKEKSFQDLTKKGEVEDSENHFTWKIKGNRGFAILTPRKGKPIHYSLLETENGFYWKGNGQAHQLTKSLRNWMDAERRAKDVFRADVELYKRKGDFKEAYSSMWSEPRGVASETHTSTYDRKPNEVTALKNYGTNNYNLGFQVHDNFKKVNGEWFFDTIYYTIDWKPSTPIQIWIRKSTYKSGNPNREEQDLSELVSVENKEAVNKMIADFKKIYSDEKTKIK